MALDRDLMAVTGLFCSLSAIPSEKYAAEEFQRLLEEATGIQLPIYNSTGEAAHHIPDLLEQQHVLIAPGSSFNSPYRDHFRITTLPDADTMRTVFEKLEIVLDQESARAQNLEVI